MRISIINADVKEIFKGSKEELSEMFLYGSKEWGEGIKKLDKILSGRCPAWKLLAGVIFDG